MPFTKGGTFTADALRLLREDVFTEAQGDREGAANVAVFLLDGVSNILPQRTLAEAKRAHRDGIRLYAIGRLKLGILDSF